MYFANKTSSLLFEIHLTTGLTVLPVCYNCVASYHCEEILRLFDIGVGAQLRSQSILKWAIAQLRVLIWVVHLKMG